MSGAVTEPHENGISALLRAWLSTSALFLAGLFIPVAGTFLMLFTPQPGLSLERRRGVFLLGLLVPLVALTAGLAGGLGTALVYLGVFAILTVSLAACFRRGWSLEKTVGSVTGTVFLTGVVLALAVAPSLEALVAGFREQLEHGREQLLALYGSIGATPEFLERAQADMDLLVEGLVWLAPGLTVIVLGGLVLLNLAVVRVREQLDATGPVFGELHAWRAPASLVWVLIGAGYGLFVPAEGLRFVAANVFLVVAAIYFCQGLAVLAFHLEGWNVRRWVRAVVYAFVVVEWLLAATVAIVGVFDQWFDFRKLDRSPDEGGEPE